MPRHRGAHSPGRPPLNRGLRKFNFQADPALDDALLAAADKLGTSQGEIMRLILSAAHGYDGPFLTKLEAPLPIALSSEELRQRVAALDASQCLPLPRGARIQRGVRPDRELAVIVDQRAVELDVSYSQYLATIFRLAVGQLPEQHGHQEPLIERPTGARREESMAS